jgi:hypothetical protein
MNFEDWVWILLLWCVTCSSACDKHGRKDDRRQDPPPLHDNEDAIASSELLLPFRETGKEFDVKVIRRIPRQADADATEDPAATTSTTEDPAAATTADPAATTSTTAEPTDSSTTTIEPSTTTTTTTTTTVAPSSSTEAPSSNTTSSSSTTVAPSSSTTVAPSSTAASTTNQSSTTTAAPSNSSTTARPEYSTIAPGSRPRRITDSDPTVSCFDNIYQKRCEYEVPELRNSTILHFQCVDYLNATDNKLLWWQELQRTATFIPSKFVYRYVNPLTGLCPIDYPNFFMSYENRLTQIRVNTKSGYLLTQSYTPNVAYFCIQTVNNRITIANLRSAILTFLRCVTHYGTGIKL